MPALSAHRQTKRLANVKAGYLEDRPSQKPTILDLAFCSRRGQTRLEAGVAVAERASPFRIR